MSVCCITCKNSQIIHLCSSHKHLTRLDAVYLIPQSNILDLNPGHTSLYPPPPLVLPGTMLWRLRSPALSLTPFVPSTPVTPLNLSGTGFPCPSPGDGWGGRSSPHSPEFMIPSAMQTPPNHTREHCWNHTFRVSNLRQGYTALQKDWV